MQYYIIIVYCNNTSMAVFRGYSGIVVQYDVDIKLCNSYCEVHLIYVMES